MLEGATRCFANFVDTVSVEIYKQIQTKVSIIFLKKIYFYYCNFLMLILKEMGIYKKNIEEYST